MNWRRRRVYPRWVANEKMTQEQADREIEIMAAILADYEKASALELSGRERLKR